MPLFLFYALAFGLGVEQSTPSSECLRLKTKISGIAPEIYTGLGVSFWIKRLAAAAGSFGVWIVYLESAAHQILVFKIYFSSRQITDADRINQDFYAVFFNNLVAVTGLFFGFEAILQSGTSAASDKDAEAVISFLFHDFFYFYCGFLGNRNKIWFHWPSLKIKKSVVQYNIICKKCNGPIAQLVERLICNASRAIFIQEFMQSQASSEEMTSLVARLSTTRQIAPTL